jgi:hypothetical protein
MPLPHRPCPATGRSRALIRMSPYRYRSPSSAYVATFPLYPPSLPLARRLPLVLLVVVVVRYQEAYPSQFTIVISGFLTLVHVVVVHPCHFQVGISTEPKSEHPPVPQRH